MLLAGDEFGRTQRGNNNAYCQDSELSWFDWSGIGPEDEQLLAFVRHLIALRKAHPALRRRALPARPRPLAGRPQGHHLADAAGASRRPRRSGATRTARCIGMLLNGSAGAYRSWDGRRGGRRRAAAAAQRPSRDGPVHAAGDAPARPLALSARHRGRGRQPADERCTGRASRSSWPGARSRCSRSSTRARPSREAAGTQRAAGFAHDLPFGAELGAERHGPLPAVGAGPARGRGWCWRTAARRSR